MLRKLFDETMKQEQTWRPNLASRLFSLKERIRPFVENVLNYLFSEMHYVPGGWRANDPAADGWKAEVVADAQEKHWPTLVRNLHGPGPLGLAHFPWSLSREDRTHHNVMMSYGYVLARAARKKNNISIRIGVAARVTTIYTPRPFYRKSQSITIASIFAVCAI